MKVNEFIKKGLISTAASILLNTVSMIFRVALSNTVGANCMGLYQLTLTVFSMFITVAVSGLGFAMTQLTARESGRSRFGYDMILRSGLRCCVVMGTVSGAAMYFGAGLLAQHWVADVRAAAVLRTFAVALPFISVTSCLSNYLWARHRVGICIALQFFEQAVRISVTTALISGDGSDAAALCVHMAAGSTAADIASCLLLAAVCALSGTHRGHGASAPGPLREIVKTAYPVALSAYARSGLGTAENLLIPYGFQRYSGSKDDALTQYGRIKGMILPVLTYPTVILTSFSGLLIPEVAESFAAGKKLRIERITERVFKYTIAFSLFTMAYFMFFGSGVCTLAYGTGNTSDLFILMAPLLPLLCVDHATDCLLKGLGEQLCSMRYNIIDACMRVALIWLLLPVFGLRGYVAVLLFSELFNGTLSLCRLVSVTKVYIDFTGTVIMPLAASFAACAVGRIAAIAFGAGTAAGAAAGAVISGLIYALLLRGKFLTNKAHCAVGSN